jgi:hypothetical protein
MLETPDDQHNNNNNNNNNNNKLQSAVILFTELYAVVPSKQFWSLYESNKFSVLQLISNVHSD